MMTVATNGFPKSPPTHRATMVRIAITQEAFDAIVATMQLGTVGYETATDEQACA
jgi:hypothetical protein